MRRIKILVTASTFPRWKDDTEPRFILDYCKELCEFFDVTVLAPAYPGAETFERIEGVKVIRYHYFPIRKWETLCYPGAIVSRIKERKIRVLLVPFLFIGLWLKIFTIVKKYDVVHSHWLIPQGIVQSFFRKPYILTGHGGDVTSLNSGIMKILKIRAIKKAKMVTVVSDALKKEVIKLIPNVEVYVRSMGCNLKEFSPSYKVHNYFQQGNEKVVLFVGRLAEVKGVSFLIDAMKKVDAKLIIVGAGGLEKTLKEEAQPQKNKIMFLGSKTHQELKSIYASADVFVAPSVTAQDGGKEGFGLVLLEAMASGIPVIGSDSGGIPEIIEDGVNGFLVKEKASEQIAEKINLLLSDNVLYERLKMGAINTVKKYDYKVIAEEYSKIIDSIKIR